MSTVRPGVMKMRAFDKDARVQIIPIDVSDIKTEFKLRVLAETPAEVKEKDIQEAKILISCGRGASDKNTLAAAGELAVLVDGSVSSSRALVDSNLMPHAKQVGQTGKTVRPTAYIAAGISGAVQHLAGMGEAEFIIAVNKDPNAPIFEASHLGVVSDATKVLPLLIEEIKKIKAEKNI
jgi:electron transfer flavoprotein alpha subunit